MRSLGPGVCGPGRQLPFPYCRPALRSAHVTRFTPDVVVRLTAVEMSPSLAAPLKGDRFPIGSQPAVHWCSVGRNVIVYVFSWLSLDCMWSAYQMPPLMHVTCLKWRIDSIGSGRELTYLLVATVFNVLFDGVPSLVRETLLMLSIGRVIRHRRRFQLYSIITPFSGQFRRQCIQFGNSAGNFGNSAFWRPFGHDSVGGVSTLVALLSNSMHMDCPYLVGKKCITVPIITDVLSYFI